MLIAALFIIAALILIFSGGKGGSNTENKISKSESSLEEYKNGLEEKISALCSSVEGVGKCKVFITFSTGEEKIYRAGTLIETKPPSVLGVTVICRGADSEEVRYALVEMLTALFGIGSNRIAILKLNS